MKRPQPTPLRISCRAVALVALTLSLGCRPCPPGTLFESDLSLCSERFCGDPGLEVGTGAVGFEAIEPGGSVPLIYGPQGGYHVEIASQMHELCEIVLLETRLDLLDDDGTTHELFTDTRRIQAVRADTPPTRQEYWGVAGLLPCAWWPDGPHNDLDTAKRSDLGTTWFDEWVGESTPECPEGISSAGRGDEHDLILTVTATDGNDRSATDSRSVRAECCS